VVLPSDTPTETATPVPSATATETSSPLPTETPTETPTAIPPPPCAGDCDDSGQVTVDEIVMMVNIALGDDVLASCRAGNIDGDGMITVDEIIVAVNNLLFGCP